MSRTRDIILEERAFFVATLKGLKTSEWQVPTLCDGWDVEDLAAHLIVRERGSLLARAGIVLPFLHHKHDAAIRLMKHRPHAELIVLLAKPPAWVPRLGANVIEFFVHNEDLLRGGLGRRREISSELEAKLSDFVPQLARFAFRRVTGPLEFSLRDESSGHELTRRIGRAADGKYVHLEIAGTSPELILLMMGRGRHARVKVSGDPEAKDLYKLADIGV